MRNKPHETMEGRESVSVSAKEARVGRGGKCGRE